MVLPTLIVLVAPTENRMLYAEPHLKPADIERLTGVSNTLLRDWRHVGLFDDGEGNSLIGTKQDNGRWLYSMSDAVKLATMQSLRNTGLERITLLSFARQIEHGIQKTLGFNIPGTGTFAVFWLDDWQNADSGFACQLTDNPRDVHTVESTTAFLFDLTLIAQHSLPNDLYVALAPFCQDFNSRIREFEETNG